MSEQRFSSSQRTKTRFTQYINDHTSNERADDQSVRLRTKTHAGILRHSRKQVELHDRAQNSPLDVYFFFYLYVHSASRNKLFTNCVSF